MASNANSRGAFGKENLSWPIGQGSQGFRRVRLFDRTEQALLHVTETPLGTLWSDPRYGTDLHRARTQNITHTPDGDVLIGGAFHEGTLSTIRRAHALYVPDALSTGAEIVHDPTTEVIALEFSWGLIASGPLASIGSKQQTQSSLIKSKVVI